MVIQLTDFADMCTQIATQITQVTAQVQSLTDQLASAGTDKAAIQQQLDAAQAQITQLNQAVNDAAAQVNTLTADKATLTTDVTNLTAQVQTLQAANTKLTQEVAALQAQLAAATPATATVNSAIMDVLTQRRPMTVLAGLHKLPANTTTSKEQTGVWIDSGGHTAQSNPSTSTIPHGTFDWTQGTDTTPARIFFKAAAPWDDIFEYEHFNLPATLPTYVVDIRTFSMTAADRAAANAVEFQQEFAWGGKIYNLAWQWNFGQKVFRYFDYNIKAWKVSPVPFVDLGATPVNLMAEFILDEKAGTTTHLAFSVNGARTPLNITQAATPRAGVANKYTISINQLDSDSHGDPFGVNIHNCEARYI